jgi:hypothetical protein
MWEAGEDVAQVGVGIDVSAAAAFDDSVDDRAALAGAGFAAEKPVFLSEGGGANGIFDEVIIDLDAPVLQVNFECNLLAQGIIDRLAEQALWQMEAT